MGDAAVPFVASAALGLGSAIFGWMVAKRSEDLVAKLDKAQPSEGNVAVHLTPGGVSKICQWAIDCAQSGVAFMAPPIAALLLIEKQTLWISVSYVGAAIMGIMVFGLMFFARPDRYAQRTKLGLTLVAGGAIAVNLVAAVVVTLLS